MSDSILVSGSPVPEDRSHTKIKPNGQQQDYVVLTPEERAKGFVKPLRDSYIHAGPTQPAKLRELTEQEQQDHGGHGYVKYEEYGPERDPVVGKFWTQAELDRVAKRCGCVTTMSRSIAETYARDPNFYSGTFCVGCSAHFDLSEFTWEPDGEPMDPELQDAWQVVNTAKKAKEAEERRQRRMAELRRELAELEAKEPRAP